MKTRSFLLALATCAALTGLDPASAQLVRYDGVDAGAGPGDARPNSDGAAASFDTAASALGPIQGVDFESLALGNFVSQPIAPGITATLDGTDVDGGIVADGVGIWGTPILGYNTTGGGAQFLGVEPIFEIGTASLAFDFDDPVQAFGAYITGLGTANGDLLVEFDDGSAQSLPVTGSGAGGVLFFGFTSTGAEIVCVTLALTNVIGTRDIFGVDDLRVVPSDPPECFLVVGTGPGSESYDGQIHTWETQVDSVKLAYAVTLDDIPAFELPVPAGRKSSNQGMELVSEFSVQVLMWNPGEFPDNPEQSTQGLAVRMWSNGRATARRFGDRDNMDIRMETFRDVDGRRYVRFPFDIDGFGN